MENMEKCWRYPNWILRIEMQIRFVKISGLENASTQKVTLDLVGFTKTKIPCLTFVPCLVALQFSCSFVFSLVTLQNSYFILCYPTSIFSYVDLLIYWFSVILNNFHSFFTVKLHRCPNQLQLSSLRGRPLAPGDSLPLRLDRQNQRVVWFCWRFE